MRAPAAAKRRHSARPSPPAAPVTGPALVRYVLLDVCLIVALARLLGGLMQKLRQPRVVGEILAGVVIGPSSARQWTSARSPWTRLS